MSQVAIGLHDQKAGAVTASGLLHGFDGRFVDRENIHAIHPGGANIQRSATHFCVSGCYVLRRSVLPVLIVLADIDNRELPDGSKIHRLQQHPLVQCTVSEETDCHLFGFSQLCTESSSSSNRNTAAYDGIRTQNCPGPDWQYASIHLCPGSSP